MIAGGNAAIARIDNARMLGHMARRGDEGHNITIGPAEFTA
jgi:hypothetical protein